MRCETSQAVSVQRRTSDSEDTCRRNLNSDVKTYDIIGKGSDTGAGFTRAVTQIMLQEACFTRIA